MVFTDSNMNMYFSLLEKCRGIGQMLKHHPEGDVFTHSLQVLHFAFRESRDIELILAAMLHDVGKASSSNGHDKVAAGMLKGHVSSKTLFLVEHHMRVRKYISGAMHKLSSCLFFANHVWLPEIIQLARWDKKGRVAGWVPRYDKKKITSILREDM